MTNSPVKSNPAKPAARHAAPPPANNPGQHSSPVVAPAAKPADVKK